MKRFKFLSSAAIAMLVLFSCNSGGSSATTPGTDSTSKDSAATPPPPAAPAMTMLIKQKVADFSKWFPMYEAHDSARVAAGLHNFVVSRGLKDSNTVMVALHMTDTAKAKEFASSPGLMEAMKKGGVMGTPSIIYVVNIFHDSTTDATTERAIIDFKVKDYTAWKKGFDADKQSRMDAGITDRAVSTHLGDPNTVSLVMAIADVKKAEAFMQSKELKMHMDSSGVISAPDVFLYHVVKQYP